MVNTKIAKKIKGSTVKGTGVSLTRMNYLLFGVGVVVLIIGYVLMSIGPVDSFMSLTLSPIVLVIGYCVIFPLAILWRPKSKDQQA